MKKNAKQNGVERKISINNIIINTMGKIFAYRSRGIESTIFHPVHTVRNKY